MVLPYGPENGKPYRFVRPVLRPTSAFSPLCFPAGALGLVVYRRRSGAKMVRYGPLKLSRYGTLFWLRAAPCQGWQISAIS